MHPATQQTESTCQRPWDWSSPRTPGAAGLSCPAAVSPIFTPWPPLIGGRGGFRWHAARDSRREELDARRPDYRAALPGFVSRRIAGSGNDQPGCAQFNRRRTQLGATGLGTAPVPVTWADSKTVVGVTTAGNLAISADAGRSWRADLASVSSGQAISDSRDKAGQLEILVVNGTSVQQSRDNGATLAKMTS